VKVKVILKVKKMEEKGKEKKEKRDRKDIVIKRGRTDIGSWTAGYMGIKHAKEMGPKDLEGASRTGVPSCDLEVDMHFFFFFFFWKRGKVQDMLTEAERG
jgi:hypothetical protein